MRQKSILGAICSAALLMAATPAAAKSIPTSITRDTAGIVGTNLYSIGHLSSPNPKCVAHRTVKLIYFYPDHQLVDTDTTSARGVWGGVGTVTGLTGLRFTATSRKIGPRRHRRTCAAASGQITD